MIAATVFTQTMPKIKKPRKKPTKKKPKQGKS